MQSLQTLLMGSTTPAFSTSRNRSNNAVVSSFSSSSSSTMTTTSSPPTAAAVAAAVTSDNLVQDMPSDTFVTEGKEEEGEGEEEEEEGEGEEEESNPIKNETNEMDYEKTNTNTSTEIKTNIPQTFKEFNNSASRIELIEVTSHMYSEERKKKMSFNDESSLGLNHYALDVTSYIQFLNENKLFSKSSKSIIMDDEEDLVKDEEEYGLDQFLEYVEQKSIQKYDKKLRMVALPTQQVIRNQIYEIAYMYDADGAIIKLVNFLKEVEVTDVVDDHDADDWEFTSESKDELKYWIDEVGEIEEEGGDGISDKNEIDDVDVIDKLVEVPVEEKEVEYDGNEDTKEVEASIDLRSQIDSESTLEEITSSDTPKITTDVTSETTVTEVPQDTLDTFQPIAESTSMDNADASIEDQPSLSSMPVPEDDLVHSPLIDEVDNEEEDVNAGDVESKVVPSNDESLDTNVLPKFEASAPFSTTPARSVSSTESSRSTAASISSLHSSLDTSLDKQKSSSSTKTPKTFSTGTLSSLQSSLGALPQLPRIQSSISSVSTPKFESTSTPAQSSSVETRVEPKKKNVIVEPIKEDNSEVLEIEEDRSDPPQSVDPNENSTSMTVFNPTESPSIDPSASPNDNSIEESTTSVQIVEPTSNVTVSNEVELDDTSEITSDSNSAELSTEEPPATAAENATGLPTESSSIEASVDSTNIDTKDSTSKSTTPAPTVVTNLTVEANSESTPSSALSSTSTIKEVIAPKTTGTSSLPSLQSSLSTSLPSYTPRESSPSIQNDNQSIVEMPMNLRAQKEGGLMVWTNATISFGSWDPKESNIVDDWKESDEIDIDINNFVEGFVREFTLDWNGGIVELNDRIGKDNQEIVDLAKDLRSQEEGGLMIWTEETVAFGAWDPSEFSVIDNLKEGDSIELGKMISR